MDAYGLTREDFDAIFELGHLKPMHDITKDIPSKAKAALTRRYIALSLSLSLSLSLGGTPNKNTMAKIQCASTSTPRTTALSDARRVGSRARRARRPGRGTAGRDRADHGRRGRRRNRGVTDRRQLRARSDDQEEEAASGQGSDGRSSTRPRWQRRHRCRPCPRRSSRQSTRRRSLRTHTTPPIHPVYELEALEKYEATAATEQRQSSRSVRLIEIGGRLGAGDGSSWKWDIDLELEPACSLHRHATRTHTRHLVARHQVCLLPFLHLADEQVYHAIWCRDN